MAAFLIVLCDGVDGAAAFLGTSTNCVRVAVPKTRPLPWSCPTFISSSSSVHRRGGEVKLNRRTESPTQRFMAVPWESIIYDAQSTANSWAVVGLQDPSNTLLTSIPILYGAGLLTSVSPCVWGLLPLTVSYISASSGEDGKTIVPTIAFAMGLAMTFCTLGIVAAQLGTVFGSPTDNPWLPVLANGVCLVMGFQLLELVQFPLLLSSPQQSSSMNNPTQPILLDSTGRILNDPTNAGQSRSLLQTFLLGSSSAVVASPCATPVLTSILAYVATAQNVIVGAALLFVYTLGYATPLLWVGATGGKALTDFKRSASNNPFTNLLAPWITPLTGGFLLWFGTTGMLTALWGDPALSALAPVIE